MSSNVLLAKDTPHRRAALWPVVILPLAAIVAWAVNAGGQALRGLILGGLVWLMALPLFVSLEASLVAMMLFEPLRGFLRRAQYLFLSYTETDPIHILTPLVTLLAFVMLLHRRRLGIFRQSPLAGLVSILGLIYFLQIFNPLQGGLTVGLSGALFMLVPVAWFYFGQMVKPRFVETMLRLIVVLGIITSVYGLYQLTFGFPGFEQYWIEHTDFYESISVGHVKRALATFSSAEEWGRYIEVGALIAFGFAAVANDYWRRAGWFVCGAALTGMLLLTGQRTAIFGLILGAVVLFLFGARTWRGVVGRVVLALAPVLLITALAKAPTNDDTLSHDEDQRFQTVLSHTARGTLRPTKEDSLQERITTWTYLATTVIPSRPLGSGIGATSLAVQRFENGTGLPPIDSYVIALVIACGLPTALLFMWILARATATSWRSCRNAEVGSVEGRVWRVVAALMPALVLNSLFGNTFTLYSVAPIGWLLVGWISAEAARKRSAAPTVELERSYEFGTGVSHDQLAA
jgi:O-Antigen ligase